MGDKAQAKRRMQAAGVPCVPGYLGDDQAALHAQAQALGLPLLVKAVAGGGGRGMRLVRQASELAAALEGARREAQGAFGCGTLMLERLVEQGRHIEVQVFADRHGHCIHLGERDCSTQRRRQKVVEEAPAPGLPDALRQALWRDAVAAAQAVGYVGAGTVEFIVDPQGRHYFLEMNTRLQVEHTVTECITGLDLVAWQLRVAAGEPLPLQQHQVVFSGHAVQARLYAEDPYHGFAPQAGEVLLWAPPTTVRVDHGMASGLPVTPHYDAMVAKLIAHGQDRSEALRRLGHALEDTVLLGPRHNARYLRDLLRHPRFVQAGMHTTALDEWAAASTPPLPEPEPSTALWLAAAALCSGGAPARPPGLVAHSLTLRCGTQQRLLRVAGEQVALDGQAHQVALLQRGPHHARLLLDGVQRQLACLQHGPHWHLAEAGAAFVFDEPSPAPQDDAAGDPARATAAVAGTVAQVLVQPGDVVAAGQPLVSVEAMKMELWATAAAAGTVAQVLVRPGQAVKAGALLVQLEGM
jgi:geranyl-CoA carboxylase alpha subunit